MKKNFLLGFGACAAMMLGILAGCSGQPQPPVSSVPSELSAPVSSTVPSQAGTADFESYFAKNPIDPAYQETFDSAVSTIAMVEAANQFADVWKQEIKGCYEKLLTLAPGEKQAQIEQQQEKWQAESQGRIDEIVENAQKDNGTLGRVQSAVDVMNFYRSRAKELYGLLYEYDQNFSYVYLAD